MSKKCEVIGQRFGQLSVIQEAAPQISPSGKTRSRYLCECKCGKRILVMSNKLRNGHTQSCGCLRKPPLACVITESGCHHVVSHRPSRFGKIYISVKGKSVILSRLIYSTLHGEIPMGMVVCHHCDNPSCINPAHLFLGTQNDNVQDMIRKGRRAVSRGQKNGRSKLSDEQVREIRDAYDGRRGAQTVLARKYGVSCTQISGIVRGTKWIGV